MKRAVLAIVLCAVTLLAGLSIYFRIEQYRFRRRSEQLLADVRELKLKNAEAAEVRRMIVRWGFKEWGAAPGRPCTQDDCTYYFQLMAEPAGAREFADPWISWPVGRLLGWLGFRPTIIHPWVQIRGKRVRSVSFSVDTLGQADDGAGRTLMAYAGTKAEGSFGNHDRPDAALKHSLLHPGYLVGAYSATLNADTGGTPAVIIWAEFWPDANASDVSRLMQFDLSCLTRLRSCKASDLMPAVWAQSAEDSRASRGSLTCTPEVTKQAASLADLIAVVRPRTVDLSPPRYEGMPTELREVELVSVIKKPKYYRSPNGASRDIEIDSPEMTLTADAGKPIQSRERYIFLMQDHNYVEKGALALYPCGILASNDANLSMVREATTQSEQGSE